MRDVSVHNWGIVVSCTMLARPEVFQDKSLAVVLIDRPRLYMDLKSMSPPPVNEVPPPNRAFSSPHPQRSLMRLRLPHGPSQLDLFDQIYMILPTLQSLGPWQARSLALSLSVIKVVNQGQALCCVYSEHQAAASCLASLCFSRCLGPLPWRPHHRLPAAGTMPRAVLVTFTQRM